MCPLRHDKFLLQFHFVDISSFFFLFLFALLNGVNESGVDGWISHAEITGACDVTAELFPLACKCNNTV